MTPRRGQIVLKQIGARIKAARKVSELSQQAVADAAGINREYLSRVERGTENVSILTLVRVAAALDIPLRNLLCD
jgi:transcriptional regulator with XRE-family HTH domain